MTNITEATGIVKYKAGNQNRRITFDADAKLVKKFKKIIMKNNDNVCDIFRPGPANAKWITGAWSSWRPALNSSCNPLRQAYQKKVTPTWNNRSTS